MLNNHENKSTKYKLVKLKNCLEDFEKRNPKNDPNLSFKYVEISGIGNNKKIINFKNLLGHNAPSRARNVIRVNDVIYGTTRPYYRNVVLVPSEFDNEVCSTGFCVLRSKHLVLLPDYLFYYMLSNIANEQILKFMRGGNYPSVSNTNVINIDILLPPLPEQHRIVTKIESIFTQIDATRDRLLKIQSKLKSGPVSLQALRSSILKQAFEGKLVPQDPNDESAEVLLKRIHKDYKKELVFEMDHLPKGWLVTAIHNIGIVITGNTPNKKTTSYYGDYIAFFKPTDLNSGYYVKTSTEKLSKEGLTKARLIPKKSILVTSIGATIGKVGFSRISGTTNQQINSIIPNTKIIFPEYLYFICVSPQFQKSLLGDASATTLPIINKSKFSKLMISLPPLNEQKRIVAKIESIFDKIDAKQEEMKKIEVQIKSISDSINTLKNSILKQAFEGKLVLQDPNDEHASVLLGRVKSQKSKTI